MSSAVMRSYNSPRYATKDFTGRLHLEKLKESLFDTDVEISDDVFILKGDDALKLKEPPRLDKLAIKPDHAMVKVGEQVSLTCSGVDQYAEPFAIGGGDMVRDHRDGDSAGVVHRRPDRRLGHGEGSDRSM